MSKYIKLEDAISKIVNTPTRIITDDLTALADRQHEIIDMLADLPTIEVEEDGEDYLRGYNDGWYAHEVITNAKLHIDKPRGFTLKTEKGYGNYSEDCISKSALISFIDAGHLRNSNEKCYSENDVVDLIKNAPSVVPSRAEGEWVEVVKKTEQYDKEGRKAWAVIYQCPNCGFVLNAIENHITQYNYCPECGNKMKGADDE